MTIQPVPLDLYGRGPIILHRPRAAAIACMFLFIAMAIRGLTMVAFQFFVRLNTSGALEFMANHRVAWILMMVVAHGLPLVIGVLLLFIANLARHSNASPWPLRFLLPLAILSNVSLPRILSLMIPIDWQILQILESLLACGFFVVGLFYALQLARLLESRSLRTASLFLLTPFIGFSVFEIAGTSMNWDFFRRIPELVSQILQWSLVTIYFLAQMGLAILFLVSALQLLKTAPSNRLP